MTSVRVGALEVRKDGRNVAISSRASGTEVVIERADLVEVLEVLERLTCAEFGHAMARASKEPVLGEFNVCLRCGKWER